MDQISASKPTILVVDDTPDNLSLMSGVLKDTYKLKVANSGSKLARMSAGISSKPDRRLEPAR